MLRELVSCTVYVHGRFIPVRILEEHHGWLSISGTLTLGDLLVGVGTMLLAWFTWRLARATYALDERGAARERKRHERRVRGVARLVLGELAVVQTSIGQAIGADKWYWIYPLPHGAWDRDGALIVETVPEDEAVALIQMYARLDAWETITEWAHRKFPRAGSLSLHSEHKSILGELQGLISDSNRYLRKLA